MCNAIFFPTNKKVRKDTNYPKNPKFRGICPLKPIQTDVK